MSSGSFFGIGTRDRYRKRAAENYFRLISHLKKISSYIYALLILNTPPMTMFRDFRVPRNIFKILNLLFIPTQRQKSAKVTKSYAFKLSL